MVMMMIVGIAAWQAHKCQAEILLYGNIIIGKCAIVVRFPFTHTHTQKEGDTERERDRV